MTNTTVVKDRPAAGTGGAVAVVQPEQQKSLLGLIWDAGHDKSFDVAKFKELILLRREEENRQAEIEFNAALGEAQGEMLPITRDKSGDKNIKYATLEKVSREIDPVLRKYKFSLSYGMADSPIPNHYRVTAKLSLGAHSRDYFIDLAVDDVGPKGERNKTAVQGAGSTISYGRRYLKLMIFDLTLTNDDNNGARHREETKPTEKKSLNIAQSSALVTAINNSVGLKRFLEKYQLKAVMDLDPALYAEATKACNDYATAAAAKKSKQPAERF